MGRTFIQQVTDTPSYKFSCGRTTTHEGTIQKGVTVRMLGLRESMTDVVPPNVRYRADLITVRGRNRGRESEAQYSCDSCMNALSTQGE